MKWIALVLFLSIAFQTSASTKQCLSFYESGHTQQSFVTSERSLLQKKSKMLRARLHGSGSNQVFDFVGIGAGPATGMFESIIKTTFPNMNTLVIEATNSFGTFDRVGNFSTNSLDFGNLRGNELVGSPLQPIHFDKGKGLFRNAKAIGDATVALFSFSESNVLLETKVIAVSEEPQPGAWPARYRLSLSDGNYVFAKRIGIGTGLGTEGGKVDASVSQVYWAEYESAKNERRTPKVQTAEGLLERSQTQDLKNDFAPHEDVIIVGNGDGASIVLEALAGLGPYSKSPIDVNKVTVVGSSTSSVPFGKKILNVIRYKLNATRVRNRLNIEKKEGRVVSVTKTSDNRFQLTIDNDGSIETKTANQLIFANGYEKSPLNVLKGLSEDTLFAKPILGSDNTIIGQHVHTTNKEHDIFVYGVAGGFKSNDAKAVGKMGVFGSFLRLHGEKIKDLVNHIWTPDPSSHLAIEAGNITRIQLTSPHANSNIHLANKDILFLLKEVGQTLRRFRVYGAQKLSFEISSDLTLTFKSTGVSEATVAELQVAFADRPNLLQALHNRGHNTKISIPVDADGFFIFEKMEVL